MKNFAHTIGEIKASYKTTGLPLAKISSSREAAELLHQVWDEDTIEYIESFCVLCLNRSNQVIAYRFVGMGGVSGVVADPKTIFQSALLANASAIIISHNHPSGNLKPSQADLNLTQKVVSAGKALDLPVLDHIILTKENYTSLADEGSI